MVTHAGIALLQLYLLEIVKFHMINKDYHEVLCMSWWYNKYEERVTGDGCPQDFNRRRSLHLAGRAIVFRFVNIGCDLQAQAYGSNYESYNRYHSINIDHRGYLLSKGGIHASL